MTDRDRFRRTIVVGDVHGSLAGLRRILRGADLIDDSGGWIGGRAVLVQTGDVVDRGPEPRACLDFLDRLGGEARRANGSVERVLGNHEMSLIRGEYQMSDDPDPVGMGARLRGEALAGRWRAAVSRGRYLITHAGVHPTLLTLLLAEIRGGEAEPKRVTVASIGRHINRVVDEAVAAGDYSHGVFHVGPARGGFHHYGGIFWADFDAELVVPAKGAPHIWQIFGHTPPLRATDELFRVTADRRRINVDIGISERYGGNLGFLELEQDKVIGVMVGETLERSVLVGREDLAGEISEGVEIEVA